MSVELSCPAVLMSDPQTLIRPCHGMLKTSIESGGDIDPAEPHKLKHISHSVWLFIARLKHNIFRRFALSTHLIWAQGG